MIHNLKPYSAYKDSGVSWLGEVPAHWEVRRLRSLASIKTGGKDTVNRQDGGKYPFFVRSQTVERINTWSFDGEAVLTAGDGVGVGRVFHYVNGKFDFHQRVYKFSDFVEVLGKYFFHYFSKTLSHEVLLGTAKSTVDSLRLPMLQNFPVSLPSLPEQTAIARFLDHADRRIRRYIRAKQKLSALLEEQKQAIIHQAVTGQIDVRTGQPYPAYKPSGVEWLGDVPTHWNVRRLKSLVKCIDQGVSPQADNYLADGTAWGVLKAGCVNRGVFRESEHKRLPPDFVFDSVLAVTTGDVLVSRASGSAHLVGSVGRVLSLKYKLILSDKTFRPIFKQGIDPDFMVLAMNSRYYRRQVEQAISGAEGLANNLPLSSLRAFHFAIPPFDEQPDIVGYLRTLTNKLGAAVTQAEQEIDLLNEYRTRLIADVVTGKLDVREAAAALPEVDPLAAEDELGDTHAAPEVLPGG